MSYVIACGPTSASSDIPFENVGKSDVFFYNPRCVDPPPPHGPRPPHSHRLHKLTPTSPPLSPQPLAHGRGSVDEGVSFVIGPDHPRQSHRGRSGRGRRALDFHDFLRPYRTASRLLRSCRRRVGPARAATRSRTLTASTRRASLRRSFTRTATPPGPPPHEIRVRHAEPQRTGTLTGEDVRPARKAGSAPVAAACRSGYSPLRPGRSARAAYAFTLHDARLVL